MSLKPSNASSAMQPFPVERVVVWTASTQSAVGSGAVAGLEEVRT
jgi:hypothetical protein